MDILEAVSEAEFPMGRSGGLGSRWVGVVGSLLFFSLAWAEIGVLQAQAQLQLNVGTSSVQPPPSPLPNQPNVLPPPPPHILRQITQASDPATTLDIPLSLMGEQVLKAVCESELDAARALSLMPDLSQVHIQHQCPDQLTSQVIDVSSPSAPSGLPLE